MKVNLKKIVKEIGIFILILPFFEPEYIISQVYPIHRFFVLYRYAVALIATIIYLKKGKISKFVLGLLCYNLVIIIATKLNSSYGRIDTAVNNAISVIAICLIIELELRKEPKRIINQLLFIFEILIYANFISMIIYPNGLYSDALYANNWLLGYDNKHIITILPGMMLTLIYSSYYGKKLKVRSKFLIVISLISIIRNFSATSVLAIVIMIAFVIFRNTIFEFFFILNIYNYIITYITLFFTIIIFRLQEIFRYLIVEILHKSLSFTGRTGIWDKTMELIKQKAIIGYGVENSTVRAAKMNFANATHAHNTILEILYKGGFLALAIYLYIIFIVAKQLNKFRDTMPSKIISITIFVFFVMMLTEARDVTNFYIILLLGYNVKNILNDINKGVEKIE